MMEGNVALNSRVLVVLRCNYF